MDGGVALLADAGGVKQACQGSREPSEPPPPAPYVLPGLPCSALGGTVLSEHTRGILRCLVVESFIP